MDKQLEPECVAKHLKSANAGLESSPEQALSHSGAGKPGQILVLSGKTENNFSLSHFSISNVGSARNPEGIAFITILWQSSSSDRNLKIGNIRTSG